MYIIVSIIGLKPQPPPPCPANYIPRLEIINEISKVIVEDNSDDSSTIRIGTTVTIRGIGGIGKSTLAKALCYHPLVKKYFIHGFLWITLTPPCLSPEMTLRDMYNKLTNNSIMCSFSLLKDRIRLLFSSHPCKLLIILDDVVDANDVTEYVEVFSNCKTVITTRKNDIDKTIPSKKCFDIGPMKTFEAVQLLTREIPQLASLSTNNADKIQELAKNLYYWPLLLSLVRGQLYVHCTGLNESPTSAILNVQHKLQAKGLTAFDPRYIKKETAVKASINASLELLSKNERDILFHIVTSVGVGSYVLRVCIFKVSKVSSEEFDKLIESIWSHGLVNVGNMTLPLQGIATPCLEIHDVIAQYIVEEMPYDYHIFLSKVDIIRYSLDYIFSVFLPDVDDTIWKDHIVDIIDVFMIPLFIRCLAVCTRAREVEFSEALNCLIENYSDIVKTNSLIKFLNAKLPLSQIYGSVKENCRMLQSMLADNRYDEVEAWLCEYTNHHPYTVLIRSIQALYNELTEECKCNPKVVKMIDIAIGSYCIDVSSQRIRKLISGIVHLRNVASEMIKAGVSNSEIVTIFNL